MPAEVSEGRARGVAALMRPPHDPGPSKTGSRRRRVRERKAKRCKEGASKREEVMKDRKRKTSRGSERERL